MELTSSLSAMIPSLPSIEWLDELLALQSDGLFAFDKSYRILYWNSGMERIFGLPSSETQGKSLFELLHFRATIEEEDPFLALFSGQIPALNQGPFEIWHPHDQGIQYDISYRPMMNRDQQVVVILGLVKDRNQRERTEQRLFESEQRFFSLANCSPFLLWTSGPDTQCHFVNKSWLQYTGRTLEQELSMGWVEKLHPQDRERAMEVIRYSTDKQQSFGLEFRLQRYDGEHRWFLMTGVPRFLLGGQFAGHMATCTDITDRKNDEVHLKHLADKLMKSNQELRQFAHIASHDLQEPLRTIINYAQLLSLRYQGTLGPEGDQYLSFLATEGKRMKILLDDLLTYYQIEGDQQRFRMNSGHEILQEVLLGLKYSLEKQKAQITFETLPVIWGHRDQLRQVFYNLIDNALKFCGEGPPQIHISARRESDYWLFCVQDNGRGLDMKYAQRIFKLFKRLHKREEYPGSGTGLAICKKIIDLHRGQIWVESQLNVGSKFFFTLPWEVTAEV